MHRIAAELYGTSLALSRRAPLAPAKSPSSTLAHDGRLQLLLRARWQLSRSASRLGAGSATWLKKRRMTENARRAAT